MPITYERDPELRPIVTRRDVDGDARRAATVARVVQVVSYLFYALYVLIAFEFVLELFAARDRNGVKQLLDAITAPFLGPFRTLLPSFTVGGSEVIFSYVVALVVYATIHLGIHRLARIIATPRSALVR